MSFRSSLTTTAHRLVTAFVTACRRASRLQVISLTAHRLVTAFVTARHSFAHREHRASCAYRAHIIAKELPRGEQQEKASEMCVQGRRGGQQVQNVGCSRQLCERHERFTYEALSY